MKTYDIPHEEAARIVEELADRDGVSHIMRNIPGVWEAISEYYNNEMIEVWKKRKEEEVYPL